MPRILVRVVSDRDTVQGINVLASWEFVRFGSDMAKQEEVMVMALSWCVEFGAGDLNGEHAPVSRFISLTSSLRQILPRW